MAQAFSDLKVALEKGKGSIAEIFQVFENGCLEFAKETRKVPSESLNRFLSQVEELKVKISQGDRQGIAELMDVIKRLKKTCHDDYKK